MRKTLLKLLLMAAGIFGLGSCNLDMNGTYTFTNTLLYSVADEETEKAVLGYFEEVIDFDAAYTFTGSQHDAIDFGQAKIQEVVKPVDNEAVVAMLGEKDIVQYVMYMTGNKNNIAIGAVIWQPEEEENPDPDPETPAS